MTCPHCDSADVKKLKPGFGNDNVLDIRNFKIKHDLQCTQCGTEWAPGCSRSEAWFLVAAGLILIAAGVAILWIMLMPSEEGTRPRGVLMAIVFAIVSGAPGAYAIIYSIRVLQGKAGSPLVLREGKARP